VGQCGQVHITVSVQFLQGRGGLSSHGAGGVETGHGGAARAELQPLLQLPGGLQPLRGPVPLEQLRVRASGDPDGVGAAGDPVGAHGSQACSAMSGRTR